MTHTHNVHAADSASAERYRKDVNQAQRRMSAAVTHAVWAGGWRPLATLEADRCGHVPDCLAAIKRGSASMDVPSNGDMTDGPANAERLRDPTLGFARDGPITSLSEEDADADDDDDDDEFNGALRDDDDDDDDDDDWPRNSRREGPTDPRSESDDADVNVYPESSGDTGTNADGMSATVAITPRSTFLRGRGASAGRRAHSAKYAKHDTYRTWQTTIVTVATDNPKNVCLRFRSAGMRRSAASCNTPWYDTTDNTNTTSKNRTHTWNNTAAPREHCRARISAHGVSTNRRRRRRTRIWL